MSSDSDNQARAREMERLWQQEAGRKWVRLQEQTDAHLSPLGQLAIDALALHPGEHVLDVGCGAGQSVLQLASLVGPRGSVVGVDISEPLLDRARNLVGEHRQQNVELLLANAAMHDFQGTFDAVYSRFGVMFFADSVAAFANLRKALRSGGRLAFVCWQSLERNDWATLPLTAVREVAPDQPSLEASEPGVPGPFCFSDPALVERVLNRAGFVGVGVEPHENLVPFSAAHTTEAAVEHALNLGPAARFVATAEAALMPRFRAALARALAPHVRQDGLHLMARTHVVTARNP
jgi:SAM-dependent methyltransferase